MRLIVTGIPPREMNFDENPPPRKYSVEAGYQVVALRQASTSRFSISQNGFIAGWPAISIWPVASSDAAPLLIRWITPPAAAPSRVTPVTRLTASGLQYVRTSAKI